ncbi:MAG: multicopper oxidase domain-containing protein [Syntrophobacteraceae bacterium]
MSATNPAIPRIPRVEVTLVPSALPPGEATAPEFVKMFDPPNESPPTPELLTPTNPVPEVMEALGLGTPATPHTTSLQLMNNTDLVGADGARIAAFTIRDRDFGGGGVYPGPTVRVPRGAVFHGDLQGSGPPPHTIHWHGIEPTSINDGVGHCSMEIGSYLYQWQANFTGSYFYHCHRNTMQHFEFGLFGLLLVEPPDAYFQSLLGAGGVRADWRTQTIPAGPFTIDPNFPPGTGEDGRFRVACNLATLPVAVRNRFPGFVLGDPINGVATAATMAQLNPHAYTVPYDVEAAWVFDDRDFQWSELGSNPFATFPAHGDTPGVDDAFHGNAGVNGFFAFNNFKATHWFVTGVPVPTGPGSDGTIVVPPGTILPPNLNGGKGAVGNPRLTGTQVAVDARVNETILIRALDAAYNKTRITFPIDVVMIAWDGRALGVPPFGRYNQAFVLPANTPYTISTARRFDALARSATPLNASVRVEFLETRGNAVTATARIPFNITTGP